MSHRAQEAPQQNAEVHGIRRTLLWRCDELEQGQCILFFDIDIGWFVHCSTTIFLSDMLICEFESYSRLSYSPKFTSQCLFSGQSSIRNLLFFGHIGIARWKHIVSLHHIAYAHTV